MEHVLSSASHTPRTKEWFGLLRQTFEAWSKDKALRLAAALAYYSVFSIAPLLVITIAMAGLFLDDEAATGQVYGAMKEYVGPQAAAGVQAMVESASKPKTGIAATIIGCVTLLLGASGVLGQLKDALNTIWEMEVKKGVGWRYQIRSRFLNFGMVLVIGLLLLMSLLLSSWLATLNQGMQEVMQLPALVWTILTTLVSAGVAMLLFAMLFKFLPDARVRWRDVWIGAAITAVLFEIGKTALGWYLGRESTADAYGSAGSVVLLILWVYYASCILLFGAEFTQVYAVARGRRIEPAPQARLVEKTEEQQKGTSAVPTVGGAAPSAAREDDSGAYAQPVRAPMFSHRLMEPLLRYFEGRGLLLSIEAKEALGQAALLLILAAVAAVTLFVAWTLFAIALVGLFTNYFHWDWMNAVSVAGAIHLGVAVVAGVIIWWRATHGAWFAETLNELRKDRVWLRGH